MKLYYNPGKEAYVFDCSYNQNYLARDAKFRWNEVVERQWATRDHERAMQLFRYADKATQERLLEVTKDKREALAMSRAGEIDVDLPRPERLEYMKFQEVGIVWGSKRTGSLIGDEMGLGKTIQGIGIINNLPWVKRVLVVCPKSVKRNWQRELHKWLVRDLTVGIVESSKKTIPDADILIVNYDILHRYTDFAEMEWDMVIADEIHRCKNPNAQRSKALYQLTATVKVGLTGTPLLNRVSEMFPIIHWLDPETWPNFFEFGMRYCAGKKDVKTVWDTRRQKWTQRETWNFKGSSNLDELQTKLRSTIMIRRLRRDVMPDLPRKRRNIVVLDPGKAQGLIDEELDIYAKHGAEVEHLQAEKERLTGGDDGEAYLEVAAKLKKFGGVGFSELSRVRYELAVAKAPLVAEYVADKLEDDEELKIVVMAHHKEVVDILCTSLAAYNPVKLTGDTSEKKRQEAVDAFQNDPKCQVFVGNLQAAGVGITLVASHYMVVAEQDYVPANVSQAEDRICRIGQGHAVTIDHLVFDGSLDVRMIGTLIKKQEIADQALDLTPQAAMSTVEDVIPTPPSQMTAAAQKILDFTETQARAIQEGLRFLADKDRDGAAQRNGEGFDKRDSNFGHSLARQSKLSPKQLHYGAKIVHKHRRQLPQRILEIVGAFFA